jgi:N6-adenosine-specific RNA methylase IME4
VSILRYPVIILDPPWQFKVYSNRGLQRSAENHYGVMTHERLLMLPVGDVAAEDCALFMWTSGPFLQQALALGAAWGFTYKTIAFTWAKATKNGNGWHMGLGYYTRANSEFVLLFTQGKPKRVNGGVRSLVVSPVTRHSQKPEDVQDRLESLMEGPYLEIFARRQRPGWMCLGDEISGNDIFEDLHVVSDIQE